MQQSKGAVRSVTRSLPNATLSSVTCHRRYAANTSFLIGKMYRMSKHASLQTKEWTDKMQPPPLYDRVDPKILPKNIRVKHQFFNDPRKPEDYPQFSDPNEKIENAPKNEEHQQLIDDILSQKNQLEGQRHSIEFPGIGSITVHHDDIFSSPIAKSLDATVIPITPNFMPYKGLSFRILEQGGEEMYRRSLRAVRDVLQIKRDKARQEYEALCQKNNVKASKKDITKIENDIHLQPGDIVVVESHNITSTPFIIFAILPYFFQGDTTSANRAFSQSVRMVLNNINKLCMNSICLPHIGKGIYGYESYRHSEILLENITEILLQMEAVNPSYNIKQVHLIDNDKATTEELNRALVQCEVNFFSEKRIVPAPKYFASKEPRLLSISPFAVRWCLRKSYTKFKKHSGIINRKLTNYRRNIRPYIFRSSKFLLEPAPLLVNQNTGDVADISLQDEPRPFYKRNLAYTYNPQPQSAFDTMKVNGEGHFRAVNKMPRHYNNKDRPTRSELE